MEDKNFCPVCGHEFKQGEGNYNYDTSLIDYTCPECGWEGTEAIDEDIVIADLSDELGDGIEVTPEDAYNVIEQLKFYDSYDEAVKDVARGIRECLGW